jgi:hypothetical protein
LRGRSEGIGIEQDISAPTVYLGIGVPGKIDKTMLTVLVKKGIINPTKTGGTLATGSFLFR